MCYVSFSTLSETIMQISKPDFSRSGLSVWAEIVVWRGVRTEARGAALDHDNRPAALQKLPSARGGAVGAGVLDLMQGLVGRGNLLQVLCKFLGMGCSLFL